MKKLILLGLLIFCFGCSHSQLYTYCQSINNGRYLLWYVVEEKHENVFEIKKLVITGPRKDANIN